MANQTGRPIAPARKLVAWIIGTIAVFVIALGLGMSSSPVAFFGGAVLIIAIAVALVPVSRRGGRATVSGTAEVKAITPPPAAGAYGRATIELIVVAPGLGAFDTTVREPRIPVEKWPLPGATVPITVDVDDTRRVRVSWRDAPSRLEGEDPPPPTPAAHTEPDDLDEELFGTVDPAPWEGREHDWEVDTDDDPLPPSGSRGTSTGYARRTAAPVVVRDTPAGTIVEGQVVDTDDDHAPLPRRAGSARHFSQATVTDDDEPLTQPAPAAARTASAPTTPTASPVPDAPTASPDPDAPGVPADDAADPVGRTDADSAGDSGWSASASTTPAPDSPWPTGPSHTARTSAADADTRPSPGPSRTAGTDAAAPATGERPHDVSGPDTGTHRSSGGTYAASPQAGPPPGGSRTPSGRPQGSRPSPRPRGGPATATVERDTPSGTTHDSPTATTTTATAQAGTVPPAQRTPADSRPAPADARPAPSESRTAPSESRTAPAESQFAAEESRPAPARSTPAAPSDPVADIDLDLDGPPTRPAGASTAAAAATGAAAGAAAAVPSQQSTHRRSDTDDATATSSPTQPATRPVPSSVPDDSATPGAAAAPSSPTSREPNPAAPAGREPGPAAAPSSPVGREPGSMAAPSAPAGREPGPAVAPSAPAGREPGPKPPPPPMARPANAPTPPPPPTARPRDAAAPPPPPARVARSGGASGGSSREQQAWARPARSASPSTDTARPAPAPTPRPSHADDRWAPSARPASPAPEHPAAPRSGVAEPGTSQSGSAPGTSQSGSAPAGTPESPHSQPGTTQPGRTPDPTRTIQPGFTRADTPESAHSPAGATETRPTEAGATETRPGQADAGQDSASRSAWHSAPSSVQGEDRWDAATDRPRPSAQGSTPASTIPPNVETRPLGSRTRFFMQPGDDAQPDGDMSPDDEFSATAEPEQAVPPAARPARAEPAPAAYPAPAQSRPERTPSSSHPAPSPVSGPPAAPQPDRPFPSAPPPATPHSAESPPGVDQIDIPLDGFVFPLSGNPEPAPESSPRAAAARAEGIIAPPVGDSQPPRPRDGDITMSESDPSGPHGTMTPPADDPEPAHPSALRDGIIGVAVGRAALSPDTAPPPPPDDVPAPGTGPTSHQDDVPAPDPAPRPDDVPASNVASSPHQDDAPAPGPVPTPHLDDVPAPGEEPRRPGSPWGDFSGRSQPDEHAADVITAYPSARPGPAGAIHGVGITVLVTDLERSTRFYRDVLGFHEIDNGDGSAVLASGDTRLVLRTVHNLSSEAGRLIYLNLEVGDIEAVHAELREKGVKFVHSPRPVNRGDKLELWSATFRDPDNHNIAITQWRAIR